MIQDLVEVEEHLTSLYRSARDKAVSRKRPVLVSVTRASPHENLLDLFSSHDSAFYWEQPDERFAMAGIDSAAVLEPTAQGRFDEAEQLWQEVMRGAVVETVTDELATGPVALGGFSFDPIRPASSLWKNFPPAKLFLPRFSITSHGESSWLTINFVVQATTDPEAEAKAASRRLSQIASAPREAPQTTQELKTSVDNRDEWKHLVGEAAQAIQQGNADKIVLARALRIVARTLLQPAAMLDSLRQTYGSCTLFAMSSNGSTFLGASPERLVRLVRGQVQVDCVAGTIGRGSSPEEDGLLANTLFSDSKERSEHDVVVQVLRQQLTQFCQHINMPSQPVILRLPNVQHLSTPLRCHLANGENILQLVAAFHPSPAIGGFPKDAAISFIRERENLDRGWYGGPIGWMDAHGQGEFAVAIRSALVDGQEAHLFAGGGIMANSDAADEYHETNIKLESMLSALNGVSQ